MPQRAKLEIHSLKTIEMPSQKRSQTRVAEILNASAELLCERPARALNTTLIADRAGIPVSSIYRYFPTIDDIVDELYGQTTEEIDQKLLDVQTDTVRYPGWRDRLRGTLETMRAYFQEHPYYRALLHAVLAREGPEHAVSGNEPLAVIRYLSNHWRNGGDNFSGGDPDIINNVAMQVFLSVEGFLVSGAAGAGQSDAYFEALMVNLESFLANYLSD